MVPSITDYEAQIEGMTDAQAKDFLLDQLRYLCPDRREFPEIDALGLPFTQGQKVLLDVLYRHRPECCADEYLCGVLSNSLDSGDWVDPDNLKQRVYYLRKVLKACPDWRIPRHRGEGYSLVIRGGK